MADQAHHIAARRAHELLHQPRHCGGRAGQRGRVQEAMPQAQQQQGQCKRQWVVPACPAQCQQQYQAGHGRHQAQRHHAALALAVHPVAGEVVAQDVGQRYGHDVPANALWPHTVAAHHHARGAACALQGTRQDQHIQAGGQRGQHRAHPGQRHTEHQHRAAAMPVRQRAIDQLQRTIGDQLSAEGELHRRLAGAKRGGPRLHGGQTDRHGQQAKTDLRQQVGNQPAAGQMEKKGWTSGAV